MHDKLNGHLCIDTCTEVIYACVFINVVTIHGGKTFCAAEPYSITKDTWSEGTNSSGRYKTLKDNGGINHTLATTRAHNSFMHKYIDYGTIWICSLVKMPHDHEYAT